MSTFTQILTNPLQSKGPRLVLLLTRIITLTRVERKSASGTKNLWK